MLIGLENFDNPKNTFGPGITSWPQHAVNALARLPKLFSQTLERNGCVDVISQHGLASLKITGKEFVDGLGQ